MLGGHSPPLYQDAILHIFCPKRAIGPSDVLQGSYPTDTSLRYLSGSLWSPPGAVPPPGTSVFPFEAPTGAVPPPGTSAFPAKAPSTAPSLRSGSRRPSRPDGGAALARRCCPRSAPPQRFPSGAAAAPPAPSFAPLPRRHPRPHGQHPSPARRSARGSRPSKPLLCFLPRPSPGPARPTASGTHQQLQGPLSRLGCSILAPPRPKAARWIWSLEVTCRSKLLVSFPQQSNCTTQAKSTAPVLHPTGTYKLFRTYLQTAQTSPGHIKLLPYSLCYISRTRLHKVSHSSCSNTPASTNSRLQTLLLSLGVCSTLPAGSDTAPTTAKTLQQLVQS